MSDAAQQSASEPSTRLDTLKALYPDHVLPRSSCSVRLVEPGESEGDCGTKLLRKEKSICAALDGALRAKVFTERSFDTYYYNPDFE